MVDKDGCDWDDAMGKTILSDNPPGGYFMTVVRTAEEEYVAAGRNYIGDTSQIIVVKTNEDGTVIWEKLLGDSNM